jgi:hypothetical protein
MNFLAELKRRKLIRTAVPGRGVPDCAGCEHRVPGFRVSQLGAARRDPSARDWLCSRVNMSSDKEPDYFSAGMTEAVLCAA